MSHLEENEQVKRESALAEMRKLAILDVNRILRNVETRKQGLARAIKARSTSVARGFAERIKQGLEEASASAETIGDTDFPAVLRTVAKSVTELEEMIPQGAGKDVSDEDVNGLSALAAGISVPSLYQPKFEVEAPAVPEPPAESESEVSRVEDKATETLPPIPEKTETPPPVSVSPLQSIEIPPENPKTEDSAQSAVVGASSKPAKAPLPDITGLGEVEEDDNLPPEAVKFADTSRVERIRRINKRVDDDNGAAKNKPSSASKSKPQSTLGALRPDPRGHEFTNGIDISAVKNKIDYPSDSLNASGQTAKEAEPTLSNNVSDAPGLEDIIAEVKDVIARGEGDNLVLVPKKDAEVRIRHMANKFGSFKFKKELSNDKRAEEIVRAVNAFTPNEILRADLRRVFRKMARVSGDDKAPFGEPKPEPTQDVSQYPEAIGPKIPQVPEGVVQYGEPIGPKSSPEGVEQYDEPIGPKFTINLPKLPTSEPNEDLSNQNAKIEKTVLPASFSFSDLERLKTEDWTEILKGIDSLTLAKAFINLEGRTDISDRIVKALPPKLLAEIVEQVKSLPDLSLYETTAAQAVILSKVDALIAKGLIVLEKTAAMPFSEGFFSGANQDDELTVRRNSLANEELRGPAIPKPLSETTKEDETREKEVSEVTGEKRNELEVGGTVMDRIDYELKTDDLTLRPTPPAPEEIPIKAIVSPNETLSKAVLEDPAGFDAGRALDVPGFDEFLIEAQKMGAVIDMADSASLQKRFEAFAFKDIAVTGMYELYAESISHDLGLSLDDDGKQAVREHLERQAHVNPESIKGLADKFRSFKELPNQIAGFERQLNELKATLTPEAQERAQQPLEKKREAFQMALRTNYFWPRWSKKEGLGGLGWLHVRGEKAAARSEVAKEARSSGAELLATFGFGLSTKELKVGLQRVEKQLADFRLEMGTKQMTLSRLEAMGRKAKTDLENAKVNLFQDSVLTKKLVGMARVKVKEKLQSSLTYGQETVEKAVDANELFEKAIRASASNKFGDDADFLEGVDVPEYRKWIDAALDLGITKEIEKAVVRSMALSHGRFGELQKAFDKLTAQERLGSKSRAEVRKFIVKKLKDELKAGGEIKADESTEDGKRQARDAQQKALYLKALIVKQQEALVLNK